MSEQIPVERQNMVVDLKSGGKVTLRRLTQSEKHKVARVVGLQSENDMSGMVLVFQLGLQLALVDVDAVPGILKPKGKVPRFTHPVLGPIATDAVYDAIAEACAVPEAEGPGELITISKAPFTGLSEEDAGN